MNREAVPWFSVILHPQSWAWSYRTKPVVLVKMKEMVVPDSICMCCPEKNKSFWIFFSIFFSCTLWVTKTRPYLCVAPKLPWWLLNTGFGSSIFILLKRLKLPLHCKMSERAGELCFCSPASLGIPYTDKLNVCVKCVNLPPKDSTLLAPRSLLNKAVAERMKLRCWKSPGPLGGEKSQTQTGDKSLREIRNRGQEVAPLHCIPKEWLKLKACRLIGRYKGCFGPLLEVLLTLISSNIMTINFIFSRPPFYYQKQSWSVEA